jgi:integrase
MQWTDARTGNPVNRSTKLRWDSVDQTRKAKQLAAQRTADELESQAVRGESWRWVDSWLRLTFAGKTLQRYSQAWFAFGVFMCERRIVAPRQLAREDAEAFLAWRMAPTPDCGVRAAKKNTALLDLKVISRIMREAVFRKLAPANPFLQLGFKKDAARHRPDILPEQLKIIERELRKVPDEDMQISWKIAMLYGRRISETCVPLSQIDLKANTITFRNKGGENRTKLLHPELVPLVKKWKREGRTHTFVMPPNFSKKWAKFLSRIGLSGITFHSIRVRVATKLMEEGVDRRIAMDFIDHSSELVHRIYVKARPEHQQSAIDALGSKR